MTDHIMLSSLAPAAKYKPADFESYTSSTHEEFIEQFSETDWDIHDAIKNYLAGDIDLEPVTWVTGIRAQVDNDCFSLSCNWELGAQYIKSYPNTNRPLLHAFLHGLKQVSALDEDEHMELFKLNNKFHDGNDDFDYAGSYYIYLEYMLITLDKLIEGTIGI